MWFRRLVARDVRMLFLIAGAANETKEQNCLFLCFFFFQAEDGIRVRDG